MTTSYLNNEFVKIDYSVIPKETFEKYGAKPFEIQKRKMRRPDGTVWNNINFFEAREEAAKIGHLSATQEILVLLDAYKQKYPNDASIHHKKFLGIEELSYDEKVWLEWIDGATGFIRGGSWNNGSDDGVFTLRLYYAPGNSGTVIGFLITVPWVWIDIIMIAAGAFRDGEGRRVSKWESV